MDLTILGNPDERDAVWPRTLITDLRSRPTGLLLGMWPGVARDVDPQDTCRPERRGMGGNYYSGPTAWA